MDTTNDSEDKKIRYEDRNPAPLEGGSFHEKWVNKKNNQIFIYSSLCDGWENIEELLYERNGLIEEEYLRNESYE